MSAQEAVTLRRFFDVFPTLELKDSEREQFEDTDIERICATRRHDCIRVYVRSRRLIDKESVRRTEAQIKRQFFADDEARVRICERFTLSAQYTPQNLLEEYRDSILRELSDYDPLEYTIVKEGEFTFPERDKVVLRITDNLVSRTRAQDICRVLDKLINVRCGLSAEVSIDFLPPAPVSRAEAEAPVMYVERTAADGEGSSDTETTHAQPADSRKNDTAAMARARQERGRGHLRAGRNDKSDRQRHQTEPGAIYGSKIRDEAMPIAGLDEVMGVATVRGRVRNTDSRVFESGTGMFTFDLYDGTESVTVKLFAEPDVLDELKGKIKDGSCVKVKGTVTPDKFDQEPTISRVVGVVEIPDYREVREDTAEYKRVELHCHTNMSEMDAVSDVGSIIKQAYKWGMPGIAITDHGVVQALTEAGHVWESLYKGACQAAKEKGETPPDRQRFFKVIQGVEGYLVDDLREIVTGDISRDVDLRRDTFVVFDLETTGFSPVRNRIIEIGAVKVEGGEITDRFSTFVNPEKPIPPRITKVTSITDEMVMDAPTIETVLPRFMEFIGGAVLVGHNVSFDVGFIAENARLQGLNDSFTAIDTMGLSRVFFPNERKHTLDATAVRLGVSLEHHHRAVDDAECTAGIFLGFIPMLADRGAVTLKQINDLASYTPEMIRSQNLHPNHVIILAKNTTGRVNLYRLISESHINYFHRHPLIPKSLLMRHREGLIVGSACCQGELYGALVEGRSEEEIARIVRFYDYLEIQPVDNNRFMITSDKYENVNSEEDIRDINRQIVALGEQWGKPVVATCDAHFLDPEEEIYRRIILAGRKKGGENEEPCMLYVRTTDEMMKEFEYLGRDKAQEVVIDNTRDICAMCDSISPVRPDKCPPVIEHSDEMLKNICYTRAHEIYGDPLPGIVEERLERELSSIIKNGFAVMYIIAQKLVWKSMEDGYLVGSRGSVGSSFVAFTAGITEVNALPPHYVCPHCHYSDFDSEEVRAYAGRSGCDMPDRVCPVCGEKLYKDGFDIPFETFLGFKGDKEPDIDLNFSGEYQSKAHKYTEVIFGYGQTFRAGTISALAEKTAVGYVLHYMEDTGDRKRKAEVSRLSSALEGVRVGTGQHPGGIIVLPLGEDINTFTPVQHPANKDTPIITTHYDYHAIDHNLLKLDILGHDDPTMVRFLQDCTGIDPVKVPLDDPAVMSLFRDTSALGIEPDQIGGTLLGCLGLPEFGTDFAMQMVDEVEPTSLSHLIRIAGLAHGTDVWLGNIQKLIEEGTVTIDTAICNRDDIMLYLIQKGMDKSLSFKIMESVRKGKGLTPEMESAMLEAEVPDWFIWSCKKIKYMFPKAHATAYVMMAWRIAWFKVHEPAAFYAAWFSIRAKSFNYEHMCLGKEHLLSVMREYEQRGKELSNAEAAEYGDMRVAQELYERGLTFVPIDLFKASGRHCQVVDEEGTPMSAQDYQRAVAEGRRPTRIMPGLTAIEGLGEKVGDQIVEAAAAGPYLSREDFRDRSHCPQTIVDRIAQLGLLGDIPKSNQISLFDLMS